MARVNFIVSILVRRHQSRTKW